MILYPHVRAFTNDDVEDDAVVDYEELYKHECLMTATLRRELIKARNELHDALDEVGRLVGALDVVSQEIEGR